MPKYPTTGSGVTREHTVRLVRVEVPARLLLTLETPRGQHETVCLKWGLPGEPQIWGRSMFVVKVRERSDGWIELLSRSRAVRYVAPDTIVRVDVPAEVAAVWKSATA